MKKTFLLLVSLMFLSYSCSNGGGSSDSESGGGGGSTPDTTAPTLSSSAPADTATEIAINTNVTLTFSEKITGVSVTSDTNCTSSVQISKDNFSNCIAGTISSSDDISYILDPTSDLDPSALYKIKITTNITDVAGNAMIEKIISFTTGSGADSTAPIWQASTPSIVNLADTSIDLNVQTDEAGTVYYVVVADGETAPTAAQVKAGNDYSGVTVVQAGNSSVTSGNLHTFNITGLTASTDYDIYAVAEDSIPNIQSDATVSSNKIDITTTSTPDTTPPVWQASTPSTANLADISVDLNVQIDEAGTIYYIVIENDGTGPTAAQILAGTSYTGATVVKAGNSAVSASTNHTFNITGLTASTDYDIYAVAEDDEGTPNVQSDTTVTSTKIDITTTGGGTSLSVGDLVISEVMANPSTATDSDGEYIEIYNTSGISIDFSVNNITIDDGGTPQTISSGTVANGGYFLLCHDTNSGTNGGITNCDTTLDFALTNGGETLTIKENTTAIDSFTYDADAGNGYSWELASNKLNSSDNDSMNHWSTGTSTYGDGDYGTPKAVNNFTYYPAPAKGEILIVEIGNAIQSNTYNDYVLLYNKSANQISLNGFYIGRDSACDISGGSWTEHTAIGNVLIPAYSYYLISRSSNTISADVEWSGALSDGYCVVITNDSTKPTTKTDSNVYDFVTISGGFSSDNFYKRKGSCQHQYTGIDDVATDFDTGQDGSSHTPFNSSSSTCTP